MNDPTTDLIPKQSVEYICRKETVSTNPDDFAHSEMFIRYLDHDAISSFGRWQWANGFNTALVAVKCGLDKIPTTESERNKGQWVRITQGAVPEKYMCPFCRRMIEDSGVGNLLSVRFPFCHCGADMRGEQE